MFLGNILFGSNCSESNPYYVQRNATYNPVQSDRSSYRSPYSVTRHNAEPFNVLQCRFSPVLLIMTERAREKETDRQRHRERVG
jgi:hypothetical protein